MWNYDEKRNDSMEMVQRENSTVYIQWRIAWCFVARGAECQCGPSGQLVTIFCSLVVYQLFIPSPQSYITLLCPYFHCWYIVAEPCFYLVLLFELSTFSIKHNKKLSKSTLGAPLDGARGPPPQLCHSLYYYIVAYFVNSRWHTLAPFVEAQVFNNTVFQY